MSIRGTMPHRLCTLALILRRLRGSGWASAGVSRIAPDFRSGAHQRGSGLVVAPDCACHREDALGDANGDALESPATVLFKVQLALEGVVDRLDQLPDGLEQTLALPLLLPLEGRSQQLDPAHSEVVLELLRGEALVGDQQQSLPVGNESCLDVEHGLQDLALVHLRVGQCPQDRHPGRRAHQIQAQAPEEPRVACAVAVSGPAGHVRSLHRGPGHAAWHRCGVDDPVVVEPEVRVGGEHSYRLLDQRQRGPQPFVVSGLLGQVREH
jgi:hypothetical protein